MKNVAESLRNVRLRIARAEQAYGRRPGSVTLLAVSKTQPVAAIRAAAVCGQADFAENYVREAMEKIATLADSRLTWHFIGPVQSNKTRPVAEHFHWVHSLDRLKIAERLSAARPASLPPLNACIQINISGEASKSGVAPEAAAELLEACATLPGLRLRGLMVLPAPNDDFERQRQPFRRARELLQALEAHCPGLDTLSMGTTQDLEAAIAEGATLVRIGTAVFGPRAR